jgi:hypothetical protein
LFLIKDKLFYKNIPQSQEKFAERFIGTLSGAGGWKHFAELARVQCKITSKSNTNTLGMKPYHQV